MKTTMITKKVPANAFGLKLGAYEFASPAAGAKTAPIKLTASSGVPFNHWYWGRIVFDYAGMKTTKERLTLDYCHREDEVVGYADSVDTSGGELIVSGEIVSAMEGDRAAELLVKGPAGVPYEASIKFDRWNHLVLESYQEGASVEVNGQTLFGPLTVIRQCMLRGIAVCPYGADPYTDSEFSDKSPSAGDLVDVTIQSHEEDLMSETTKPDEKTPEQIRAELAAQSADYISRFGGDRGAKWFAETKPLVDCYSEFVSSLREEHKAELKAAEDKHAAAIADLNGKLEASDKRSKEAEDRLASISLGEKTPVAGTPAKIDVPTKLSMSLGEPLARFAAGMKLPKKAD